jgi:alkylation response protein AidB-like acyl-CoA dehydrogenase
VALGIFATEPYLVLLPEVAARLLRLDQPRTLQRNRIGCAPATSGSTVRAPGGASTPGKGVRDAKLYEIGAGTSEIRRMLIGRELFRLAS